MVWVAISKRGVSKLFVAQEDFYECPLYKSQALTNVFHLWTNTTRSDVVFWLDLAACHYGKISTEFMEKERLYFVKRHQNTPNAPQIRPIEQYWGILKQKVYQNNWSAQSREQLIARIKWAVKQIDPEIITKMFDHLPSKIRRAQENGLDSVLRSTFSFFESF